MPQKKKERYIHHCSHSDVKVTETVVYIFHKSIFSFQEGLHCPYSRANLYKACTIRKINVKRTIILLFCILHYFASYMNQLPNYIQHKDQFSVPVAPRQSLTPDVQGRKAHQKLFEYIEVTCECISALHLLFAFHVFFSCWCRFGVARHKNKTIEWRNLWMQPCRLNSIVELLLRLMQTWRCQPLKKTLATAKCT